MKNILFTLTLLISFNSFGQTEEGNIYHISGAEEYYESGEVMLEVNYVNGELLDREEIMYYESGAVKYKSNYVDGELHGEEIEYYESGEVMLEVNYVDGLRQGEVIKYYENGEIKGIDNYKDGVLIKD